MVNPGRLSLAFVREAAIFICGDHCCIMEKVAGL
jgi:hypothetical protein